ncbi:MAG TPA: hypothetical protein VKZ59_13680 [Acidobacteriota bacterium]|nr:hypothetical protein [Acidobacteriota bacterium]
MDDELKSAIELAMEKVERGDGTIEKLSDDQKAQIAEIRSKYRAKIAEAEISLQSKIKKARIQGDIAAIEMARQDFASERQKLEERMEREIRKVRDNQ